MVDNLQFIPNPEMIAFSLEKSSSFRVDFKKALLKKVLVELLAPNWELRRKNGKKLLISATFAERVLYPLVGRVLGDVVFIL